MEQFAKALRDGIDEENGRFAGWLIGKFHLTNVRFHFVEIGGDTEQGYADAAGRTLEELPATPVLAVLYPYFVNQLEDEQYLQGFGLRQGRFDFAITNLGLVVEVKVMRKSSDTNGLEAEIADYLALCFNLETPP